MGRTSGTVIAKILTNFSIAALMYWAVGFAFAFGIGDIIGHDGFFLRDYGDPQKAFPVMGLSDATIQSKWFFQFVFCAVSLAIVWGTTLERIKFGVYIIYAIVFAGFIYPIGSHWVFGGGWLQANLGMQDFAGSTAVHLIGATGALAVLLHLGPRRGKYGKDGKPRAIPGHNMPLFGLGVLILWLGWFGFNPGSTLGALDGRFPEILVITQMAASAGVLGAILVARWKTKSIDIGMAGNGAIGALVAITAPSGYVELWTAPIIGFVAGCIVPLAIYAIDKKVDDPVGALTAHGICGVWGTLACGLFTAPRLAEYNGFGDPGLIYTGSFEQLGVQALGVVTVFTFVFVLSYGAFWAIKKTYGLRVTAEEEDAGWTSPSTACTGTRSMFRPVAAGAGRRRCSGARFAGNLGSPSAVRRCARRSSSGRDVDGCDRDGRRRRELEAIAELPNGIAIVGGDGADSFTLDVSSLGAGAITFDGGGGTDTIVGPAANTTWNVTGAGTGAVSNISFANVESLPARPRTTGHVCRRASGSLIDGVDGGEGGSTRT